MQLAWADVSVFLSSPRVNSTIGGTGTDKVVLGASGILCTCRREAQYPLAIRNRGRRLAVAGPHEHKPCFASTNKVRTGFEAREVDAWGILTAWIFRGFEAVKMHPILDVVEIDIVCGSDAEMGVILVYAFAVRVAIVLPAVKRARGLPASELNSRTGGRVRRGEESDSTKNKSREKGLHGCFQQCWQEKRMIERKVGRRWNEQAL